MLDEDGEADNFRTIRRKIKNLQGIIVTHPSKGRR